MLALLPMMALLAAITTVQSLFVVLITVSVIGLLLDPWPAKVWRVVCAALLLIVSVLLVVGVGGA